MEPNYSSSEIKKFNLFFNKTESIAIEKSARNLNELSRLFDHNLGMLSRINPIWNAWDGSSGDKTRTIEVRQWELDKLSEMKTRLAQAIEQKKNYYQNHWFGKITRCFLKIFGLWDDGNTATIKNAEEKLFATDTRNKLIKSGSEYEVCSFFFPLVSTDWVRNNLNTNNFYNYDPNRRIKIKDNKFWNNGNIESN